MSVVWTCEKDKSDEYIFEAGLAVQAARIVFLLFAIKMRVTFLLCLMWIVLLTL